MERRIAKVKGDGKWVEIWFTGDNLNANYTFSSKWGYLREAVDNAELNERLQNHGYVGLLLTTTNEIVSIRCDDPKTCTHPHADLLTHWTDGSTTRVCHDCGFHG